MTPSPEQGAPPTRGRWRLRGLGAWLRARRYGTAARLVRGGALLTLSQGVDLAAGFAGLLLLTNRAGLVAYGVYGAVVAAASVAALTALPGMVTAIQYSLAHGHHGALAVGTRLRVRSAFWGLLGLVAWAGVLYWRGQQEMALAVALTALVFPWLYSMGGFRPYLIGQGAFGRYLLSTSLVEIGKLAFLWIGAGRLPAYVLVAGYFAVNAALNACITLYYIRSAPNREVGEQLHQVSGWLTAAAAMDTATAQLDQLIVSASFSIQTMAVFSLALTLTEPVRSLAVVMGSLLFQRMVRQDLTRAAVWRRQFAFLAGLAGALALLWLAYLKLVPPVIPLLFPAFKPAVAILPYTSAATALLAWGAVALQVLWGRRSLRPLYVAQMAFPVVRLALVGGLVWALGFPGLLWARVAHGVVTAVATLTLLLVVWRRRGDETAPQG